MSLRSYTLYRLLKRVSSSDIVRIRTSASTDCTYQSSMPTTPSSSSVPRTIGSKSAPILALLVIIGVFIFACKNGVDGPEEQKFVPGEVIVVLDKDSDYDSVQTILKLPQIKIAHLYYWLNFYSYVTDVDSLVNSLLNNEFIDWAWKFDIVEINGREVTPLKIYTKSISTKSYYMNLIESFSNIDSTVIVEADYALIEVPVGEERKYENIYNDLAQEYSEIRFSVLNVILRTPE